MNEIIERVAELLAGAAAHPTHCSDYRWQARAAIEAMREPTESQVVDGFEAMRGDWQTCKAAADDARDCWRAMIDGALED